MMIEPGTTKLSPFRKPLLHVRLRVPMRALEDRLVRALASVPTPRIRPERAVGCLPGRGGGGPGSGVAHTPVALDSRLPCTYRLIGRRREAAATGNGRNDEGLRTSERHRLTTDD